MKKIIALLAVLFLFGLVNPVAQADDDTWAGEDSEVTYEDSNEVVDDEPVTLEEDDIEPAPESGAVSKKDKKQAKKSLKKPNKKLSETL